MKKILIITDSLALPREKPEICAFEDTWPELLKKNKKFQIHQVSIGGATITDLLKQISYHKMFHPDIVLVQAGIVDCASRFATRLEIEIIKKIPYFGNRLLSLMNTYRFRNFRNKTYTNSKIFKNAVLKLDLMFKDADVFFIAIVPALSAYEKELPRISQNIQNYNHILQKNSSNYISLDELPNDGIMSDYHHINKIGHKFIFNKIKEFA